MGNHTLRDILVFDRIPTIPSVAENIFRQLQESKVSFSKFSNTVRFDPGLVCALIGHANSKLNGLREVTSIHNAILECGPKESLDILQKVSLPKEFQKPAKYHEMFEFGWSHCITQGIAAESFKEFGCQDDVSTMFLVGLVSDIGVLALMQTYPDEYYDKVWQGVGSDKALQSLEQDAFGFSHVTVGHELARRWRLGESFSSAILQHHHDGNGSFYSIISQASSKIAELLTDSGDEEKRRELDEQLSVCFRLAPEDVDLLLEKVQKRRLHTLQNLGLKVTESATCQVH